MSNINGRSGCPYSYSCGAGVGSRNAASLSACAWRASSSFCILPVASEQRGCHDPHTSAHAAQKLPGSRQRCAHPSADARASACALVHANATSQCFLALTVARVVREVPIGKSHQHLHDAEADDKNVAAHHPCARAVVLERRKSCAETL